MSKFSIFTFLKLKIFFINFLMSEVYILTFLMSKFSILTFLKLKVSFITFLISEVYILTFLKLKVSILTYLGFHPNPFHSRFPTLTLKGQRFPCQRFLILSFLMLKISLFSFSSQVKGLYFISYFYSTS